MSRGTLARAGLVVTGAFLASRVLGWLRVLVLGNLFGKPDRIADLDAYYAAFRIPDLTFELVAAGAIASALIPVLSGLLADGDQGRAWRVASSVINLMLAALLAFAVVFAVFAPAIVPLLVPGFDEDTTALTVELTRIMLIAPIFLAAGSVVSAILQTQDRFGAAALAPVVYNASIIGGALLLSPALGIHGVALGVVIGAAGHLLVQLPALRGRFSYSLRADVGDPAARETFWLMLPRAIGMGANQITFLVNTALASTVAVGAVVSYTVAFSVLQIPLGVIGLPLGIVLLPSMSRALAIGQEAEFAQLVTRALRLLLWLMAFVAAVGIVARDQVVDLLFGWGFDDAALAVTAAALDVFLLGLPAHAMNVILARAFYSGKDTVTPVTVAIVSVVVNVAVSVATVGALGVRGLALGIAVGAWFEATTLLLLLRRRHADFVGRPIVSGAAWSLVGALMSGLVAAGVLALELAPVGLARVPSLLLELGLAAGAGLLAYVLYSRAVRLPELDRALDSARRPARPMSPAAPALRVVDDAASAPAGWHERAVALPGGHVMQSATWGSYRATQGFEPHYLTFDDGRVAMATLRHSTGLPGVEASVRRGPAHADEPPSAGCGARGGTGRVGCGARRARPVPRPGARGRWRIQRSHGGGRLHGHRRP